ncbi:MAG: CDP-glycerol glycerophosphotransferase family protein, partial [Bacilli bacterium]|nr:CDP-glycerol glycerophosphotransferase family protein [Bacilli bacterium]
MRKIELIIARMLVKITFYLTYLFRIKKQRISIISYFNDQLGLEYTKLNNELIKKYEVKYDLRKFNNTYWGKLQYLFSFIYQTYLFNTSAIVILDGNSFVLSTIKKKPQVKTIQIWHAIGAIKDFGSKTRRRYQIKDYDYLITSSPYFSEVFAQRLNTDINHCYDTGYIKSDYLFDKDFISKQRTLFYDKYPQYLNKKLI